MPTLTFNVQFVYSGGDYGPIPSVLVDGSVVKPASTQYYIYPEGVASTITASFVVTVATGPHSIGLSSYAYGFAGYISGNPGIGYEFNFQPNLNGQSLVPGFWFDPTVGFIPPTVDAVPLAPNNDCWKGYAVILPTSPNGVPSISEFNRALKLVASGVSIIGLTKGSSNITPESLGYLTLTNPVPYDIATNVATPPPFPPCPITPASLTINGVSLDLSTFMITRVS
jgi:hypothetical protein